jgi:hypothetical protein
MRDQRQLHGRILRPGVTWLHNSDEANLATFMRHDDKDEFVVAINFSNRSQVGWVELMNARQFKSVKISGVPNVAGNGFPLFRLNGFEWRIYHRPVTR